MSLRGFLEDIRGFLRVQVQRASQTARADWLPEQADSAFEAINGFSSESRRLCRQTGLAAIDEATRRRKRGAGVQSSFVDPNHQSCLP
jgi:hypothetical protein